jgi:hypothetical protein
VTDGADSTDERTSGRADGATADVAKRLGRIVEGEAKRALEETEVQANPARVAEGWERRFLADATRAAEAITLYEALGFETCADPIRREDLTGDCDDCQLLMLLQYRMIYTRRPPAAGHGRA